MMKEHFRKTSYLFCSPYFFNCSCLYFRICSSVSCLYRVGLENNFSLFARSKRFFFLEEGEVGWLFSALLLFFSESLFSFLSFLAFFSELFTFFAKETVRRKKSSFFETLDEV